MSEAENVATLAATESAETSSPPPETSTRKKSYPRLKSDSSEDVVDPRVQVELEKLNTATDLINRLEIELDDARANFRLLLTESSQRINQMASKLGSCIERGRPYYEARMRAKEIQQETQKAALKFERASSAHAAAKEMVKLSEEGLCQEGRTFDPAWQEMLNHATMKVNDSEHERRTSKAVHQRMSQAYNAAEQNVQQLHMLLKKSIVKSSLSTRRSLLQLNNLTNQHELQLLPYFEMKAQFNQLLEEQKRKVQRLEENVLKVKMGYSEALHNLERISDEIHMRRKLRSQMGENEVRKEEDEEDRVEIREERTEGVGSEDPAPPPFHHTPTKKDQENSPLTKPGDLELKASLAEMEEMTPMTPNNFLFSPRQSIVDYLSSNQIPNGFEEVTRKEIVPSLSHLAQQVVGLIPSNSELVCASDVRLELLEDNTSLVLGASAAGERNGTPLRHPNVDPIKTNHLDEMFSDNESLASTDTADTLDDHHIECLLLDKVLEQDYQDILASTSDNVTTP